jgi:endonuclease YncB( thermonuclease family)
MPMKKLLLITLNLILVINTIGCSVDTSIDPTIKQFKQKFGTSQESLSVSSNVDVSAKNNSNAKSDTKNNVDAKTDAKVNDKTDIKEDIKTDISKIEKPKTVDSTPNGKFGEVSKGIMTIIHGAGEILEGANTVVTVAEENNIIPTTITSDIRQKIAKNITQEITKVVGSEITTGKYETATVIKVVDGDTFIAEINGKEEKIRLIGCNTPESVGDYKDNPQPYGKEASDYTKGLLKAKSTVYLTSDIGKTDKYGRLLRYVWLSKPNIAKMDSIMVNAILIKNGMASIMTVAPNVKYSAVFLALEQDAREADRGLWGIESKKK